MDTVDMVWEVFAQHLYTWIIFNDLMELREQMLKQNYSGRISNVFISCLLMNGRPTKYVQNMLAVNAMMVNK